ncbi:TetR/AcrR family transcriptional regulator [Nocardia abscessus]|uniref:TetR/AcrR family transcriptional regulator n=1 Tax=Nocardia abscessus TaxID=120957 RepID=UPI0024545E18|nr:TetR/AcrR family transcriptional regulator [Nocardia abscessus]
MGHILLRDPIDQWDFTDRITAPLRVECRPGWAEPYSSSDTIRHVAYLNSGGAPASEAQETRRGGRPRDDEREGEILEVVASLLAERGYEGVTFEEVARRAGSSKATLYRRWKSKRDMVVAALKAGPARREGADEIDTGSLRGDLIGLCQRLITTMRSADGQTALLLLQAGLEDPELCEEIERTVGPTGARLPSSVVDAAIRRGELPEVVDPFPFEEVAGAVLLLRRLNGLNTDDVYLEALVDSILIPALRATSARSAELPAGIFSGRPSAQSTTTSEGNR